MTNRASEIATAREIDTRIAAAWEAYHVAMDETKAEKKIIAESKKAMKRRASYDKNFEGSVDFDYYTNKIEKAEARIIEITAAARPLADIAVQIDKDEYTGWNRFFMVEHIHRSQHCSSFRPTTRIGWLPKVSGLTEAEAVAEHGSILCTICFPSAPIEWTNGTVNDPNVCSGSGKAIRSDLPRRSGYYSGNYATCEDCGKRTGVSNSAFRIPKHKPEAK